MNLPLKILQNWTFIHDLSEALVLYCFTAPLRSLISQQNFAPSNKASVCLFFSLFFCFFFLFIFFQVRGLPAEVCCLPCLTLEIFKSIHANDLSMVHMLQMKSNICMFMAYTVFRPVGCTSLGPNIDLPNLTHYA